MDFTIDEDTLIDLVLAALPSELQVQLDESTDSSDNQIAYFNAENDFNDGAVEYLLTLVRKRLWVHLNEVANDEDGELSEAFFNGLRDSAAEGDDGHYGYYND